MTEKDKILKRDYIKSQKEFEFKDRFRKNLVQKNPITLALGYSAWEDYVVGFSSLRQLLFWYFGKRVLATMDQSAVRETSPNSTAIYWIAIPLIIKRNDGDNTGVEKIYSYTDEQLEEKDKRRIEFEKSNREKGLNMDFTKTTVNPTYKDFLISQAAHRQRKVIDFLRNKEIKYYAVCKSKQIKE